MPSGRPARALKISMMFGPTYKTRSKRYDMDEGMREILYAYWLRDHLAFLSAFVEGVSAGRIWEVSAPNE